MQIKIIAIVIFLLLITNICGLKIYIFHVGSWCYSPGKFTQVYFCKSVYI